MWRGQLKTQAPGFFGKEFVRDLDHDAGPVAGLWVSAYSTPVLEVLENAQAVVDRAVALDVVDVGNEANAAGIMLVAGVTKPMRLAHPFRQHMK
jgi:hypothetical protein